MSPPLFSQKTIFRDGALCILSAGLLILSFPKTDIWIFAWVGLIPLMIACDGKNARGAFGLSYFCGVIFFGGVFHWLRHVTLVGAVCLVMYLALYFGLFGWATRYFKDRSIFFKLFLIPSSWVIVEFLRAHLFSGFGWSLLGYSQYKVLPLIQIADMTGAFGVSFILVMVNFLLKEIISLRILQKEKQWPRELSGALWTTGFLLIIVFGYGFIRLQERGSGQGLRIAIIQGNVSQQHKWNQLLWPEIFQRHLTLTQRAAEQKPDLIIWPETSFPGILDDNIEYFMQLKKKVSTLKIPLLFGAVIEEDAYYNTALLLSKDGNIKKKYRKQRLVPFGEFVPFRKQLPFLASLMHIEDFTPGDSFTLFSLHENQKQANKFSVLICFEDTVSRFARKFVQRGSQLLITITNDAWFLDTKEPFEHLQAAVFTAVENRRTLVRAANSGVSCFIDRTGHIFNYVQNGLHKKTFVPGFVVGNASFNTKLTFFTKFGDFFTFLCFGCILLAIIKKNS